MRYREFGRTGFSSSVVGMGTYYDMGWIVSASLLGRRPREEQILRSLLAGMEGGMNLIDTAEIYRSEPIIAKAIKGRERESLFIASKAFPTHFRREKLIRACERSLRRLNTKYVDLYQLHFPSRRVPIAETMAAMEELVERGLVRNIGVSNFSLESMIEAQQAMKKYRIACTQMHYNLSNRKVEKELLPFCEKNGIALLPYFPLAHGKLARSDASLDPVFSEIAARHGLTTNAQVALAYLTSRSECIFPIPRARSPAHVAENIHAGDAVFSEEEMGRLQSIFPSKDSASQ